MPSPFEVVAQAFAEQKRFPRHKLLVSGLTRGGTLFCANFLGALGIFASHEGIFGTTGVRYPDRDAGRHPTVEVSGLSALWVPLVHAAQIPIVQIVRHPLHCCASNMEFWSKQGHPVSWAEMTDVYLQYHSIIEKYARFTVHLERFAHEWYTIPLTLGLEEAFTPAQVEKAWKVNRGTSTASSAYTWEQLPKALRNWAEKHGYTKEVQ